MYVGNYRNLSFMIEVDYDELKIFDQSTCTCNKLFIIYRLYSFEIQN